MITPRIEKSSSVVQNFSNLILGACFNPHKECFSLQTLGKGAMLLMADGGSWRKAKNPP